MSKFKNLKELEGAYKELEEELADMERSKLAWENKYFKLEKQLAEKDRIIESLKPIYESVVQTCHNDAKEIDRLNKVIAEKETDLALSRNEINTLKHNLNVSQEHYKVMCEKYFQKCQETNENKISFAVEKLEKVKEEAKHYGYEFSKSMNKYINNQIKELEIEKILEFYINTEDKNKEPLLYVADEISSPFPNFKGKIKQTTLNKIMKDINANCKTKKDKK